MFFKRRLLEQIEEYTKWKGERLSKFAATGDREYLLKFAEFSKARDVTEILEDDMAQFSQGFISGHQSLSAHKALRCFKRYYKARGYPMEVVLRD